MIDFRWTEPTLGISCLFLFLYALFVIIYYKKNVKLIRVDNRINLWLIFYSFILIMIISDNSESDWYHYQQMVWDYDFTIGARNYAEPVYAFIIRFVNKNYLLFRFLVWGTSLCLSCCVFKRFGVNLNMAVFFMVAAYLIKFNYSRATLAMANYFLGLSFLIKPMRGQRVVSFFLVILFFFCAYTFHHSLLPVLFFSLVAFFPLNKLFFIAVLLIVLPFVSLFIFNQFSLLESFDNAYFFNKVQMYIAKDNGKANFFGILSEAIDYSAFIIPLFLVSYSVLRNSKLISIEMLRLWRVMITILYFALTFLFMGLSSLVFTYRYLFMVFIPLTVMAVYLYKNNLISKKAYAVSLLSGVLANSYQLLYSVYKFL